MSARDTIISVEAEIDATFATSRLADLGFAQAAWTLLSVNEDCFLKALHQLRQPQLDIFADIHLNALTHPLRVCFQRGNKDDGPVRNEYVSDHYQLAWDWIQAAQDYVDFCTIFPLWHRDRLTIFLEDGRLIIDNPSNIRREYEAYNRLVGKEGRVPPAISPLADDPVDLLLAQTSYGEDCFRVNFTPQLVARLVSVVSPAMALRYTLPDNWCFKSFTLRQYRQILLTLQSMLYGWHRARAELTNSGMKGLGYRSSVWVVSRNELTARLRRYTGVDGAVIGSVLDLITFGSSGIRAPDIAIQPLIDLGGQTYALAPFVWLNINVERNLCVLLNQIQQEREVYSRLVRDKEVATRDEMRAFLVPFGFDLKWGKVGNFGP